MFSATQKRWIVVYLLITMPISGASVDIYVPSLPAMTAFFGVDTSITQLTITFFCWVTAYLVCSLGRCQTRSGVSHLCCWV